MWVAWALVLGSAVAGSDPSGQQQPAGRMHVIIHRQALQAAPQNRWAALKQAVRWGADQTVTLEVDLHATKDGRIILFHHVWFDGQNDEVFGPTTDWLWEEINDIDFGSWYDRRFTGERLVLFEEALEFCKLSGVRLTLDIKETVTPAMVRAVLKRHEAEQVVYWSWRGGFGRLVGRQIKIMGFDGDRELVRRAVKDAAGNTIWVDDPRVLLDVLGRPAVERDAKMPPVVRDYRPDRLEFESLARKLRGRGDAGRVAAARLRKHFPNKAAGLFVALLRDCEVAAPAKAVAARALGRLAELPALSQPTEAARVHKRICARARTGSGGSKFNFRRLTGFHYR